MPKTYVKKSIEIQAPPEQIFAYIKDFQKWPKWSPWIILEPDCTLTFAPDGSRYQWEGKTIGSGEIKRTAITENQSMDCELQTYKPWKSTSDIQFTLEANQESTTVTWIMNGSVPLPMFWMKPMIEGMVGMDYGRGLSMLKDLCETGEIKSHIDVEENAQWDGCDYIGIQTSCPTDNVGPTMEQDIKKISDWMEAETIKPSAPPLSIYHKWDLGKGTCTYTIGFPVETPPEQLPEGFICGIIPATPAFTIEHTGPYRHLGNAWSLGILHSRCKTFTQNKKIHPFEVYLTDPTKDTEDETKTRIYFPTKS